MYLLSSCETAEGIHRSAAFLLRSKPCNIGSSRASVRSKIYSTSGKHLLSGVSSTSKNEEDLPKQSQKNNRLSGQKKHVDGTWILDLVPLRDSKTMNDLRQLTALKKRK
jgi:hypothetical protein